MKLVSVISNCYNEEDDIDYLVNRVRTFFSGLPQYRYEHVIIDNQSSDHSVDILQEIAAKYSNIKVFKAGQSYDRSPQSAIVKASSDAAIILLCDLHDSPDMIGTFLDQWETKPGPSSEHPAIGLPARLPSREAGLVRSAGQSAIWQ